MGFFRAPYRPDQKPQKRSRLSLLLFLAVIFAGVRLFGNPVTHPFHHATPLRIPPALPILPITENDNESPPDIHIYKFSGTRLRGNGTYLDLGDRRTHLPASLLTRFFPDPLIAPSCLTQTPPPIPATGQPARKPLPVRDDWPGFYGAPWIARSNGNLIALLHVYAPRNVTLPVSWPQFEIYADYDGRQSTPDFSTPAPASFMRGSKAVLYQVFPNGPVRCLDLVVKNGENNGIGHLYYEKYHHYYETDIIFQIQP